MKKNAVPELNYKWWKKNKAKTMKTSGLGKVLTLYEAAEDQMDWAKSLKALSEVKKKVVVAIGCCDAKTHAETIAALKKYPGVIQKKQVELEGKLKDEIARAKDASSAPAPKQKVGKDVVIWKRDIGVEALKKAKPKNIASLKGYEVKLKLNDDILDVLEAEDDLVTPAYMAEDAEKLGQRLITDIAGMLSKFDEAYEKVSDPKDVAKIDALLTKQMKTAVAKYQPVFEKIPEARWKKFVASKKQYKQYKIKTGLDITIGVLSTAGGAVAVAGSAATGGASLVLGIVGLVRGIAALAKQIQDAARDAEKVEKVLKSDLDTLMKRYQNAQGEAKKKTQGGAEVGASVLKGILGVDAPFLATLPKCSSNYGLWDNKVAGLAVAGRKLSGQIVKGLAACDKLDKMLKGSQDKEVRKVLAKLQKARASLDKALNGCSDMMTRVSNAETNMPKLKRMLDALSAQNPKYAEIFDRVFPAVVNLTLAGASAGVGFAGAKSVLESVNTGLGLFNEIALEGKSQLEATLG
ncbi:hypothetical protein A9Q94_03250 [Rhodobacterales bacterium 56_14_T64]|nr:hypothetical protein A9Q94_03250 [Rhodobacterales bacterium 56_14_T64]